MFLGVLAYLVREGKAQIPLWLSHSFLSSKQQESHLKSWKNCPLTRICERKQHGTLRTFIGKQASEDTELDSDNMFVISKVFLRCVRQTFWNLSFHNLSQWSCHHSFFLLGASFLTWVPQIDWGPLRSPNRTVDQPSLHRLDWDVEKSGDQTGARERSHSPLMLLFTSHHVGPKQGEPDTQHLLTLSTLSATPS